MYGKAKLGYHSLSFSFPLQLRSDLFRFVSFRYVAAGKLAQLLPFLFAM